MTVDEDDGFLLWSVVLLAALYCCLMTSCSFAIPVRVVPTDQPILVAPVGQEVPQADGTTVLNPELPQPKKEDYKPPVDGWGMVWQVVMLVVTTVLGGGGLAMVSKIGKLKSALQVACNLADDCAVAETDEEVAAAKKRAADKQDLLGVRKLTQKARNAL